MPTTESSSPTATSAVNEKRRPPLTTLATRLISITRSCRSRPLGLTVSTAIESTKVAGLWWRPSEPEAPFAGALGDRGDAAMEAVSRPVEDARLDAGALGSLGEQLPDALGLLHRTKLAELRLGPGDGGHSAACLVVDQLREHAAIRPVYGEARPLHVAANASPDPAAAAEPPLRLGEDGQCSLLSGECSPAERKPSRPRTQGAKRAGLHASDRGRRPAKVCSRLASAD